MLTVAVVDDEWLSVECLTDMLATYRRWPLKICCFTDPVKALAHLKSEKPDIIFVDIKMPQLDGFELITRISEDINPDLVPVIISGYSDVQFFHSAFQHNAVDYVLKPFKQEDFFLALDRAIDKHYQITSSKKHAACYVRLEKRKIFEQLTEKGSVDLNLIDPGLRDMAHKLTQDLKRMEYRIATLIFRGNTTPDPSSVQSLVSALPYASTRTEFFYIEANRVDCLMLDPGGLSAAPAPVWEIDRERLLRVGISAVGHQPGQLPDKLKEATAACHFSFYTGSICNEYSGPQDQARYYSASGTYEQQLGGVKDACLLHKSNLADLAGQLLDTRLYLSYWDYRRNLEQLVPTFALLIKNHALPVAPLDLEKQLEQSQDPVSFCQTIIRWLAEISDALENARQPDGKLNLVRTIEYIEHNFTQDISLDFLANLAKVGRSYYCALFKQQTGRTPVEYITEKRIRYACRLIEEGKLKINEISVLCGYADQYYFYKIFKKQTGQTPGEYLRQLKPDAEAGVCAV
jgi:two-component system response regulator YesN